ncbi:OsmC family protein [Pseudochryseolinea flava]|uniref:OsmC family peroxiredoxin n=1 Tax=Pseudochryseolinea flava TaxID=2059302 RepID=A0A364XW25_9BACT|nr:OsmC family protein [Pseudochryseolinea flava]RAV97930.1 OsmC family peroxiredoxin [Pseudochryseolinea flava]
MKFTRKANAKWSGSGKDGLGNLTTDSTVLNQTQYSYKTRFESGVGTNPEELIAAAHAGCFTMQLAFLLDAAGYSGQQLETEAKVIFEDGNITQVQLTLTGKADNIDLSTFQEIAQNAKRLCPISKALNAMITLEIALK